MDPTADELRKKYLRLNRSQRFNIANQRIRNEPEYGPDRLVAALSALEGYARSLAVDHLARDGRDRWSTYESVMYLGPIKLLKEHVLPSLGLSQDTFSEDLWARVKEAITFRNLVVHEATYLGGERRDRLTEAVVEMFAELGRISVMEI